MKLTNDGRRYSIAGHRGGVGLTALLKWQFGSGRARWPKWIENTPQSPPPERRHGGDLNATWIGQSTVLIQTAGLNILTDPFLSARASPLQWAGPKRVRSPGLEARQLPPIDVILLSHNHYDHMDLPALKAIARHHTPHLVTPHGNARYLQGVNGLKISELGWSGSIEIGSAKVTAAPALHWSKRGLFDANRALWSAFVVETPGGMIYFAGDTGFGEGTTFADVRKQYGPPRLSLLPIGAYEPRWFMKPQHMNPEEAAAAHLALESRTSLAIHHATVQLTEEAIDAPAEALGQALAARGIDPAKFLVPDIGHSIAIP